MSSRAQAMLAAVYAQADTLGCSDWLTTPQGKKVSGASCQLHQTPYRLAVSSRAHLAAACAYHVSSNFDLCLKMLR